MPPEAWRKTCFYVQSTDKPVAEKMEINTIFQVAFFFILTLGQVKVKWLKFLSKSGGHLLFVVFRDFTGFPVHSVGHVQERGTGYNFPAGEKK